MLAWSEIFMVAHRFEGLRIFPDIGIGDRVQELLDEE